MNRLVLWLEHFDSPAEAPLDYTPEEDQWWARKEPTLVVRTFGMTAASFAIGAVVGWLLSAAADPSSALEFDISIWKIVPILILGFSGLLISIFALSDRKGQMVRSRRLRAAMQADESEPVVDR